MGCNFGKASNQKARTAKNTLLAGGVRVPAKKVFTADASGKTSRNVQDEDACGPVASSRSAGKRVIQVEPDTAAWPEAAEEIKRLAEPVCEGASVQICVEAPVLEDVDALDREASMAQSPTMSLPLSPQDFREVSESLPVQMGFADEVLWKEVSTPNALKEASMPAVLPENAFGMDIDIEFASPSPLKVGQISEGALWREFEVLPTSAKASDGMCTSTLDGRMCCW